MPVFKAEEIKDAVPPSALPADAAQPTASDWWANNAPSQAVPKTQPNPSAGTVTDAQRQYAPPVPRPPVPHQLQTPDQQKKQRAERASVARPETTFMGQDPASAGISAAINLDPTGVLPGAAQAARGVKHTVTAKSGREAASGVHETIGGVFDAATPLMAGGLASAPVKTVRTLASALVSQSAVEHGLEWLGLPKEYAQVAGDFAGVIAGAKAHGAEAKAKIKAELEPKLKDAALTQMLKVETDPAKRADLEKQAKARGIQIPEVPTRQQEASEALGETAQPQK